MSQHATLKAEKRTDSGKGVARKLRAAGKVPGVVYGQGEEATLLTLDAHDTMYLFENISVENTIVEIEVEGEKAPVSTLVREVQMHPFRSQLLHVDFYTIQKGVTLDVNVPLHLHGDAPGVKEGGVLQQLAHDISVNTIPSKIPDEIVLDISEMEINDQLTVADLPLPEGVTVDLDPETTLIVISPPRKSEEEEEGIEPDTDAPAEPELVGEADASDEEEE